MANVIHTNIKRGRPHKIAADEPDDDLSAIRALLTPLPDEQEPSKHQEVQTDPATHEWLTIEKVCEELTLSRSTVYTVLIKKHGLLPPGIHITGSVRGPVRWERADVMHCKETLRHMRHKL